MKVNIKHRLQIFADEYVRLMKLIIHDQGLLLFFLFLPLAYPIVYSLIYNPELVRDVKMVVVDNDRTPYSRRLVRDMDATQEAKVIGYAANMTEAKEAMHSHQCYAILEIPEGLEQKVGRGDKAAIPMYCEMSLLLRYRGFLVASTNIAAKLGAEIQATTAEDNIPLSSSMLTGDVMPISSVSMGNIESGFCSFIMPGIIILILQQCIILAIGMMGGAYHEHPQLLGENMLSERPAVLTSMLARILSCITMLIVPVIFLVYYVPWIFSLPMSFNILERFLFLLPMILGSCLLGLTVQGLVSQRENIIIIWVATSVAFLFLSGLTWPRYAMSPFWSAIGDLIPATWGIEGFIRMNTNGGSLAQQSHAFMMEWVLVAFYGVTAWIVQRFILPRRLRHNN